MSESTAPFSPFVTRTENIVDELKKASERFHIDMDKIDFNIVSYQTYIKGADEDSVDWEELEADDFDILEDDDYLLNEKLSIKQVYDVEIFYYEEIEQLKRFKLSIAGNKTLTKIYASMKKGSIIEYKPHTYELLQEYIDKRKARIGILIGFRENNYKTELRKFVDQVRVHKLIQIKETKNILVSLGVENVPTVNDQLIEFFKTKQSNVDDYGRINYAKRGYVQAVEVGEVIARYIKPQDGKPGRNCKGDYIVPKEPTSSHMPNYDLSDAIIVEESEDKIEYVAKAAGRIEIVDGKMNIIQDIELEEISFKTTGSVEAGKNTDVKIHVKQTDPLKDAIGTGMEVEAHEIVVEGNLGGKTKLISEYLDVQGQTHQTSYLEANEASLNIHKGFVKARQVNITRLEAGQVEGDEIFITQAVSGQIHGKNVFIEILGSNVEVFATQKIEIEQVSGSDNILTITSTAMSESDKEYNDMEFSKKESHNKILNLKQELKKMNEIVAKNKDTFINLQKKLVEYKKHKIKPPKSFSEKMNEFTRLEEEMLSIKDQLVKEESLINQFNLKEKTLQGTVLNAKIINHGVWVGHNRIRFEMNVPKRDYEIVPPNDIKETEITLQEDDESEYKIKIKKA